MPRKRNKKSQKRSSPIFQELTLDVKAKIGLTKTVVNPEGEISMSDAISNIIAPYRNAAPDYQSFQKLVSIACTAWNATFLSADNRTKMLDNMRQLMPDQQSREDFTAIVQDLMKRKNKLYPNINRIIVQFRVTNQENGYHIAIASTLEKKAAAE